jgi:hypothetical protein
MKRTSILATAALGTALTLGAVGIGTAVLPGIAGAATATATADGSTTAGKVANHPRLRHLVKEEGKVAASTIGITPTELRDAVKGGQSVAEVAQAHGVDPQTVVDAVVADLDAKLDEAVADGKITQERATKIEGRLPTRIAALVERHRTTGG